MGGDGGWHDGDVGMHTPAQKMNHMLGKDVHAAYSKVQYILFRQKQHVIKCIHNTHNNTHNTGTAAEAKLETVPQRVDRRLATWTTC